MYRPNFCNDCGEKIERRSWRWWTNRRFCAACTTRLRSGAFVKIPLIMGALILAGFLAGSTRHDAPPPLIIERSGAGEATMASGLVAQTPSVSESSLKSAATSNQSRDDIEDPNEAVSICGARTKKGTPCSRRVRGVGRCFQHRGKGAMLPASKLVLRG
ncbi:MAG: hypothetical protein MSG64_06240 [Pyrinomonadaceae bacterium MAG19_C2-C3]|nr:hypothetical protein [Pyrinomonadaceae bacterium MAG19_C2-C3]